MMGNRADHPRWVPWAAPLLAAVLAGGGTVAWLLPREHAMGARIAALEREVGGGTLGELQRRQDAIEQRLDAFGVRTQEEQRSQSAAAADLLQRVAHLAQEVAALQDRSAALSRVDQLASGLAELQQRLADLDGRLRSVATRDDQPLLDRAAALAREQALAAVADVQQALAALQKQVPARGQIESELIASLAAKNEQVALGHAHRLLGLSSDLMQTIGLAQLASVDPVVFLTELRGYLQRVDPDRSPETVRLALGLLAESRDVRFHVLLLDAASGGLNARLTPQALVALSTVDLAASSAEMPRLALANVLRVPLVDDPNRFNSIIDVTRAALGGEPAHDRLAADGDAEAARALQAMFLRFFRNYLGARLLGLDTMASTFPILSVEKIGGGSAGPISASNRDRALYLCKVAKSFGVEREAAQFLLSLVSKVPSRSGGEEQPRPFLGRLLEELSGQRYGEDWPRWQAWARG